MKTFQWIIKSSSSMFISRNYGDIPSKKLNFYLFLFIYERVHVFKNILASCIRPTRQNLALLKLRREYSMINVFCKYSCVLDHPWLFASKWNTQSSYLEVNIIHQRNWIPNNLVFRTSRLNHNVVSWNFLLIKI